MPGQNDSPPIIIVPLISGEINKNLVFKNPEQAASVLGEHYDTRTNFWIGAIRVRTFFLMEKIDHVRAFNADEGWVVVNVVRDGKRTYERREMKIIAQLELTPTPPKRGPTIMGKH